MDLSQSTPPEDANSRDGLVRALPEFNKDDFAKLIEQQEFTADDIADNEIAPAFAYWQDKRGDLFAPKKRDIRLDELPTKLIPSIALVDFVGEPIDYHYRFFGSNLVQVSGMELTGKRYFADKIQGYGFVNEKLFPQLIEQKEPIFHRVTWQSIRGLIYHTTSARLPLSDDGQNVTGAVTANSWARSDSAAPVTF
jgi:hypothetical protein